MEERIKALIYKHLAGELSPAETEELFIIGERWAEVWYYINRLENPALLEADLCKFQNVDVR